MPDRRLTLTEKIQNIWPMILTIVSLIAFATTIKNKVDANEVRGIATEQRSNALESRVASLETAVTMIHHDTDRLVNELLDKK